MDATPGDRRPRPPARAVPVAASSALGGLAVLVGVGGSIWAFAVGMLPRLRPRDAYNLSELRRVHDEEEIRALDPEGALGDPMSVVCPRCLEEYPYRLGACPRCGASR